MKRMSFIAVIASLLLIGRTGYAQNEYHSLVTQPAPAFKVKAVVDGEISEVSLSDYPDTYKILIFYPADFSFICPTELFAFQDKIEEFKKINATLLAISVDQVYAHQAWLEKPKDKGGIQGISYPLLSDINKKISSSYGVLDEAEGVALRAIVIIDKNNIVQHLSINNSSVGRDIDEVLRVLKGIQFTQEHGNVCPANWHEGQETIKPTHEGLEEYLEKETEKPNKGDTHE